MLETGLMVWLMDRMMSGEENGRLLRQAGGHCIRGEKLRDKRLANFILP